MDAAESFDGHTGQEFIDYYQTVRGYVRQEIPRYHLLPELMGRRLRVLDHGGGDGRDAIWLAEQGHEVVVVDVAEAMLQQAHERLVSGNAGIKKRVSLIQGDERTALKKFGSESFDLVLSHGVLMYQLEDPEQHLGHLYLLLKKGGSLSLLTKGYSASYQRLHRKGEAVELHRLETTNRVVNNLGLMTLAYTPDQIKSMLKDRKLDIKHYYGVRIDTDSDKRPIEAVDRAELALILDRELALSEDPKRKDEGQMIHYLASRVD